MKKNRKISLVWRLTFTMTVIILAITAAVCAIYIQTFWVSINQKYNERLERGVLDMKVNITESVADASDLLNQLFYKIEFSYYMDANKELSDSEIRYYISSLSREMSSGKVLYSNKFSDIGVYSSNKQIDSRDHAWQLYMEDFKLKPYYQEIFASQKDEVYGSVRATDLLPFNLDIRSIKVAKATIPVFPIYRKVYNLNTNDIIGVVELDIDVERLAGKAALSGPNSLSETSAQMEYLLFDEQGELLFETMFLDVVDTDNVVAGAKSSNADQNVADIELKDQQYRLLYYQDEATGLICASALPKTEVIEYMQRKVLQIILIAVAGMILASGSIYFMVDNLLKRLVVLDKMLRRVGKGDFSAEIKEERVEDEITRISYSFNQMAGELDQVMDEKIQHEKAQKDAELRALQAQINPHFLYNTLENMRMQCEIDEYYELGERLQTLSDLFRYSIKWGESRVPFALEWENLQNYIGIMQMRFADDLKYDLQYQGEADEVMVPKMILQPLVENCFNHGFKQKIPPWRLQVTVEREDDLLKIKVQDNGAGISKDRLKRIRACLNKGTAFQNKEQTQESIGVTNVNERICLMCGPGSGLQIESNEKDGTIVFIRIVLQGE